MTTLLVYTIATWLAQGAVLPHGVNGQDTSAPKVNVTTFHYNNQRLGWNPLEQALTPSAVTSSRFGHLWTRELDGPVRHSPLVATQVVVNGTPRDLVLAATDENSVYALDAQTGNIVWSRKKIARALSDTEFYGNFRGGRKYGILSTPVIDLKSQTLYACMARARGLSQEYALIALNITTGASLPGYPAKLSGQDRGTPFRATELIQRGALSIQGDWVIVPFGARGDTPPWRGWVVAIHRKSPAKQWLWAASPYEDGAGIWSGGGVSADTSGNLYATTGNGTFDLHTGGSNAAESVVRLKVGSPVRLIPKNYYTPKNFAFLDEQDEDLGGTTPNVLPDQPGTTPHLLFVGGKDGKAYLLNRDHLGGVGGELQQERFFCPENAPYHEGIRSTSCYFDAGMAGRFVVVAGDEDGPGPTRGLVALALEQDPKTGRTRFRKRWTLPRPVVNPSCPIISSNGARDAIVWVVQTGMGFGPNDVGTLLAFDAVTGAPLFDSGTKADGSFPGGMRFTAPTVANGTVFVPTNGVSAFGLRSK